jgi:hypothetical protein
MSEFTLPEGQGYIYVGEYVHKFGKEMPLKEKKIGKIDSLTKIPQIDDYAFSLDFMASDIYLVENVDKIYSALIAILDHDNLKEDWFEDTDNDLKERVASFMKAFGYVEICDVDNDGIPDHLDDFIG